MSEHTTLSWPEFKSNIIEIKEKSDRLNDSWQLITHVGVRPQALHIYQSVIV